MGTYLMMLYVSLEQEEAVKNFFKGKGWYFRKPDLSVTTDKTGPPLIQLTATTCTSTEPTQVKPSIKSPRGRPVKSTPKVKVTPKRSKRKGKSNTSTEHTKKDSTEIQEILQEAAVISASVNQAETAEEGATAIAEIKVEQDYTVECNDNVQDDNFDDYDDYNDEQIDGVMPSTSQIEGDSETGMPDFSDTTPSTTKKRKISETDKTAKLSDDDWVPQEIPVKRFGRKVKRKMVSHDVDTLTKAVAAVKEEKMPIRRAAKRFMIPKSTLVDYVSGKSKIGSANRLKITSPDEECTIKHIRRRQYSGIQFSKAYHAASHQNMSITQAAKTFGVPEWTLSDRFKGRFADMAYKSALNESEENILVDHLKYTWTIGYEFTNEQVTDLATEYSIALEKKKVTDPRFGEYWFKNFKKRWPDVKTNNTAVLRNIRSKASSSDVVDAYYNEFKSVLDTYNLSEHPDSIYILDEIQLSLDKDVGNNETAAAGEANTYTLVGCGNASGGLVPPYLVLPGKEWDEHYLDGTCNGTGGECSESGMCNAAVMKNYFEGHFQKFVRLGEKQGTTLILYDGHKMPLTLIARAWAEQNNVIFHLLPSFMSSACQLDIGCFASLSIAYAKECQDLHRLQNLNITKANVGKIINKCYLKTMTPETLTSGFSRVGLYPYAKTVVELPVLDQAIQTALQSIETEKFDVVYETA